MQIYQITDTHVAPEAHHTRDHFETLMAHCEAEPPELLVLSGDLTREDADVAVCGWMAELIPAGIPHVVLQGNHDDAEVIAQSFPNALNPDASGTLALPLGQIDLVFANTGAGSFPGEQLEWLQSRRVRENSILFTHYPTREVSGGYMDRNWALSNRDEADAALRQTRLGHVFCGHFHAEYAGKADPDAYELHVTPSPSSGIDLHSVEPRSSRAHIPLQVIEVEGAEVRAGVRYLGESRPDA